MTATVSMVPWGSLSGVQVEDVLHTAPQPLVVLDAEIRIVAANPAFHRTFGFGADGVLGSRLYDLGDGAWNVPALRALLEDILPARSEFFDYEIAHRFGPSGHRTVIFNAREIRERSGVQRFILLALEDVTVRRSAEALLQNANRELRRSNVDLHEFTSIASHDLQEPLRKIQIFGDRLERLLAERLDDDSRDALTRIRAAATRMRTLISNLLAYARLDKDPSAFVPVKLSKVVRDAMVELEVRFAETGARVTSSTLPVVMGDRSQLTQLFENLLGNALKFRRPGVPLEIGIDASLTDAGSCEISVSDNGMGFAPEYAERIFGMFRRVHSEPLEGSGIGLALCRRIVERHAGRIRAEGRPGTGARFVVTMPFLTPGSD